MMGSFIGIIVNNSATGNIRAQVSSDKVIIFFAKHQNIGAFIIAKEINKNLDKINQTILKAITNRKAVLEEKQSTFLRFYGIQLLLL